MERYKPIIDSWEEFRAACETLPLYTVRKNQIKAGEDFEERLRESFERVEKTGWNPDIFRLKDTGSPGSTLQHWLGEYYVQEESATIPVEVLDPQKGEKILDMCAAPGGKATQIASKIENQGMVIANDVSGKRMQSLHANVYRTGSACISATNYDGRNLPEDEKYDRVLLDAPCSGEGDRCFRNFESAGEKEHESLSQLQKKLVEKAEKLLKEDGVLVYSTCTIAPEENEAVVDHTIKNTELEIEEIDLEAEYTKGVSSFEDMDFSEEVEKSVRVYPHHLDSGVIFVARFQK